MIEYRIMAVPKRRDYVMKILTQLGEDESIVTYEDRNGAITPCEMRCNKCIGTCAMYTAKRTWLKEPKKGATHICVIQDDVELCEGFKDKLEHIASNWPYAVTCGFMLDIPYVEAETPYFLTKNKSARAQALCMPVLYIRKAFLYATQDSDKRLRRHDDIIIDKYIRVKMKIPIITTIPQLANHLEPTNSTIMKSHNSKHNITRSYVSGDLSQHNWASCELGTIELKKRIKDKSPAEYVIKHASMQHLVKANRTSW